MDLFKLLKCARGSIRLGNMISRSCSGDSGGGVVLGVYCDDGGGCHMTPATTATDHAASGKLARAIAENAATLRAGRPVLVTEVGDDAAASTAALVSLGSRDAGYDPLEHLDVGRENVRAGVGRGVRALAARGCARVCVDGAGCPDAAAEAAELAAWRFQEFRACEARTPQPRVELAGAEHDATTAARWREGAVRGRAQNWARHLTDMPANRLTPVGLAQAALDALCPLGVRVEVHERAWLAAQDMQCVLAVARGSCEEPVLLEAAYDGPDAADAPLVLLAAKGVTFDSGGVCLKQAGAGGARGAAVTGGGSMAGAAVALAALRALAELQAPVRVRLVAPLCENMVSGQCMKVGDVVRALNGLTIQIEDTDMEGRLLLADALVYGQARYAPSLAVDVATLTQGVAAGVGGGAFGCFVWAGGAASAGGATDAWGALRAAGAHAGDRPWRFPLWNYYHKHLTDDPSVDLRNKGSSRAAPCMGAAFLKNFVCCPWVHLDISGVSAAGGGGAAPYLRARRSTGRPARTLVHFLQDVGCSAGAKHDH